MAKKPLCFIISPIGEPDSETRRDADDLLDLIIRPALDIYNFEVIRGDHRSEANQIDVDVIKSVQDAQLCIADVSQDNVNVFYEIGRRDETGKPLILLKKRGSRTLPVDIATRRYIEFDLDDRHGIRDARLQLQNFVGPLVEEGFEGSSSGASLSEIASTLQRVERKLDRISKGSASVASAPLINPNGGNISDPKETFFLARKQNNVQLMEACLDQLSVMMNKWKFLDFYVEVTAMRGSQKAGNMMIEHAEEFMDESSLSFKQKVEYLGALVSFAIKNDREQELLELIESLADRLEGMMDGQDNKDIAQVYNQRNRLYHGIYETTEEPVWLEKAIHQLKIAQQYQPDESYIFYNLAICCYKVDDRLEEALDYITQAIAIDAAEGEDDDDHLELAFKLYRRVDDPRQSDVLERLRAVNPIKAQLLS